MKAFSAILFILLVSFGSFGQTTTLKWSQLKIAKFQDAWNKELQGYQSNAVYSKSQLALDQQKWEIEGIIQKVGPLENGDYYYVLSKKKYNFSEEVQNFEVDQVITINKKRLRKFENRKVIVRGVLDLNTEFDPYKLYYTFNKARIIK